MFLIIVLTLNLLSSAVIAHTETQHCDSDTKTCTSPDATKKFLFYDVNPPEGFNLRRDVYMRFAIMLSEAQKRGKKLDWILVLPPWYQLYHWKTQSSRSQPMPWRAFFDIKSLKSYVPVAELHEVFNQTKSKILEIDTLYVLQNYLDAFENGVFEDKWEVTPDNCEYDGQFWGYKNVTAKEIICVRYQGKISMIWELLSMHPIDTKVMIAHGEIPLHISYGTKQYWDCRKSMKFNQQLIKTATEFISSNLGCNSVKCTTYVSVHWRRQDFALGRKNEVPSVLETPKQIMNIIKRNVPHIRIVYIATDASLSELEPLLHKFEVSGYKVYTFVPSSVELDIYKDGGVAIIDQIICSRAAFFIGTHESTFTYRIQEEREILGFDSKTTFNRLCPDEGSCEKPSKWTIVN